MLTFDQFDSLIDPVVELFRDFEDAVIFDIARRLGNLSFASAAWSVQRLSESGMLYNDILERLSKLTGQSEVVLRDIFQKAGVRALKFDDSLYIKAGLRPLPLNLSPSMISVLKAGLRKTQGLVRNLTMTMAQAGQETFVHASDIAYQEVVTGAFSYDQAIRQAVKDMASRGLSTVQYGKQTDFAGVAVRRTVLTGVAQTTAELQLSRAAELGCDLIQMSAHLGARPEHQLWQGRVFSISGTGSKYPPFIEGTGYGTITGYAGVNCRHSAYPFFEGISQNAYDQAQLDEYANKTVTLPDGRVVSQYEASQIQRGIERHIRDWKRQAGALGAAGLDNIDELAKVKEWQAKMRLFVKETGLIRQSAREQIK